MIGGLTRFGPLNWQARQTKLQQVDELKIITGPVHFDKPKKFIYNGSEQNLIGYKKKNKKKNKKEACIIDYVKPINIYILL